MQNLKTVVLLAAISGLLIAIGGAIGGLGGVAIALAVALALNAGSYWFSADIVLKTSKAHEIAREDDPALFRMIEGVAAAAEMPMPRVYVIDSPQPNAFATGRSPKHAAVAVTTGIRRLLNERELRGVLGHEMAHVANRDILTSSIVATIASAISMLSFFAFWFGDRRNGWALLIGAIVAEFFGTPIVGMGFRISTEVGRMNVDMVWAEIFMAAVAGSLFYGLMALAERAVTFWHPSYRQRQ